MAEGVWFVTLLSRHFFACVLPEPQVTSWVTQLFQVQLISYRLILHQSFTLDRVGAAEEVKDHKRKRRIKQEYDKHLVIKQKETIYSLCKI